VTLQDCAATSGLIMFVVGLLTAVLMILWRR
jgi:uncharacterized protein (TIGR03382 family)